MKRLLLCMIALMTFFVMSSESGCEQVAPSNTSAIDEQAHTEINQRDLNSIQPAPHISWSLERDNLIRRFKMMNDRSVLFYMYVFIEGDRTPIGYYQVNKVSSVNSQLTNTMQVLSGSSSSNNLPTGQIAVLPSPAEDGSYGENGNGVFGFTPEDVYIEHNMHYMVASVPLHFDVPKVNKLLQIDIKTAAQLKELMKRIGH